MEDKGEREEYDMLFRQLSPAWREKVIKEETTKPEGKNWYRVAIGEGSDRSRVLNMMENWNIEYDKLERRSGGS